MQDVRARGELKHRISYEASGRALEAMISAGIQTGFGDEWIKFGATSEHMVDGSFSERTMALSTPYPGVTPPYKGNITETQETLNEWVERVHRAGIQVNCHANGDVAIDMYLTAAGACAETGAPRQRAAEDHALHAGQPVTGRADQGDRRGAGALHDLRLLQPRQVRVLRRRDDEELHGVPLAAGCGRLRVRRFGLQPGPFAPLMGIQGMVTRKGWDGKVWGANQRISVSEAIAVNTYNGAWASGEEAIKGSITAGKLADYVVLADDPHTVGCREDQGHPDRPHRRGRSEFSPGLAEGISSARSHVLRRDASCVIWICSS